MKIKNKGKVYPSPSSSSSSSSSVTASAIKDRDRDVLSILKLLPAAILALASVLSLEDREVLAYMITRSMKTTTTPNPSSLSQDSKKKSSKKPLNTATATNNHNSNRKSPIFDCDCFDCYTSFWFRWDSSPNRELIHQVIEAFEDHLTNGEQSKKSTRGKKKDKAGKRVDDKTAIGVLSLPEMREMETPPPEINESSFISPDGAVASSGIADNGEDVEEEKGVKKNEPVAEEAEEEEITVVLRSPAAVSNHKGLARKVLPDVLGLFNSRLWSLWSPNV